jgi:hypothetical protein
MPTVAKRETVTAPLIQISWITKTKGQTRTGVITLGSPLLAILLFFGGAQFERVQRVVRSVLAALGAGR